MCKNLVLSWVWLVDWVESNCSRLTYFNTILPCLAMLIMRVCTYLKFLSMVKSSWPVDCYITALQGCRWSSHIHITNDRQEINNIIRDVLIPASVTGLMQIPPVSKICISKNVNQILPLGKGNMVLLFFHIMHKNQLDVGILRLMIEVERNGIQKYYM